MCNQAVFNLNHKGQVTLSEESHLTGDEFNIPGSQSNSCICHHLCFDGAQTSCGTGLNEAVQHHIQQVRYLKHGGDS